MIGLFVDISILFREVPTLKAIKKIWMNDKQFVFYLLIPGTFLTECILHGEKQFEKLYLPFSKVGTYR